jgi:hypothetical protein
MSDTPKTPPQSILRKILDYDPVTHRLTPKPSIPQGLPSVRTNGKHQIIIDSNNYSLAKIAYVYHHGVQCNKVTRVDGNKDNYAPSNLTGYVPEGRKLDLPYVDAVAEIDPLRGEVFRAVLRAPAKTPYKPQTKYLPIYDEYGYGIVCESKSYAIRMGTKYRKALTSTDMMKLGLLPPKTS